MRPLLVLLATLLLVTSAVAGELPFLPRDGAIWAESPVSFRWTTLPRPLEDEDAEEWGLPERLRPEVFGSRDEILDVVWGYDAFPSSRTIDNFILRLRRRFELNPHEPRHFHTVHSVGYRFTTGTEG